MKKIIVFLSCVVIFAGCGGPAKTVKVTNAAAPVVKYNIGIAEDFEGDNALQNITEKVVKEIISFPQVKFVDRRKLGSRLAGQAAKLAEGSEDSVKLEDPMKYIITGSVMSLGAKKIIRVSIIDVQTGTTEASITFDYERAEDIQGKISSSVVEIMKPFSGQKEK